MLASSGGGDLGGLFGPSWDGAEPFVCAMNERVTIEGVDANLPGAVAITATQNCEVTIVDSNITARIGIQANGNGLIRLQNTTIRASEVGVSLSINKDLILEGGSITSDGIGVVATLNSEIRAMSGTIEGSPAVRTSLNATLYNTGAQVIDR